MNETDTRKVEAAVFQRLLKHLNERKDVQNIDLMNLSGFCRNCLSKWYTAAATELGHDVDLEASRTLVYGMPYKDWKDKYQTEASEEQLALFAKTPAGLAAAASTGSKS